MKFRCVIRKIIKLAYKMLLFSISNGDIKMSSYTMIIISLYTVQAIEQHFAQFFSVLDDKNSDPCQTDYLNEWEWIWKNSIQIMYEDVSLKSSLFRKLHIHSQSFFFLFVPNFNLWIHVFFFVGLIFFSFCLLRHKIMDPWSFERKMCVSKQNKMKTHW